MNEEVWKKYEVTFPEEYMSDVMREVVSRRSVIENTGTDTRTGQRWARFTSPAMYGFREWLFNTTAGTGEVEELGQA